MNKHFNNWRLEQDEQHIIWLTLDRADETLNFLNEAVFVELEDILSILETDATIKGMILQSGKKTDFILGMDLKFARDLQEQAENKPLVIALTTRVQKILDRLASLPYPTVAVIKGLSLGGGFEIPLALRYRIADIATAKFALPETKLGINPNWGGIYRLPRLIGGPKAMRMILSGQQIDAEKALELGCIDACYPEAKLKQAAIDIILHQPKRKHPTLIEKISNLKPMRFLLGYYIYRNLLKKVNPQHYPAHYTALAFWRREGAHDSQRIREACAKTAGDLFYSPTAKNLFRVFFLQQELKQLGKNTENQIKRVHVIGAGIMGGDIAAWSALHGYAVTLQDRELKLIEPALIRAQQLFTHKIKDLIERRAAAERLQADVKGEQLCHADLIIEAIFEDKATKIALYRDIEPKLKSTAILASNTSSIPLEQLAEGLTDKSRLIGLHFFNPVTMMPLVEVIHGIDSSTTALDQALGFVHTINKLPIPVKSNLGFLVNRLLMSYQEEAMLIHFGEGVPAAYIDAELIEFGMPVGPIELVDIVGIDVAISVTQRFIDAGLIKSEIPRELKNLIKVGDLGKKTGRGIYLWKNGKVVKPHYDKQLKIDSVLDRLILRLLNEAAACLHENLVSSENLIDAASIFGMGFPPFRGGVLHYARERGVDLIQKQLTEFTQKYGERFSPSTGWQLLK